MNILLKAPDLTNELVKEAIKNAKAQGETILEFTAEPLIGSYLTIELKDYDENGEELPTNQTMSKFTAFALGMLLGWFITLIVFNYLHLLNNQRKVEI